MSGRLSGGAMTKPVGDRAAWAARMRQAVLWIPLAAYAGLVLHDYSTYVDRYPYLAVDDALANVSYALAAEGRYGFLASPTQGMTDLSRHDGFFNYGPWYFWLGSALIWLFGYSLALIRSIHLLVIFSVALAAVWWFRRSPAPVVGFGCALGLLYCFDVAQWPMARPDVAVSGFAVLLFIAAGTAMARGSAAAWGVAGLAAGCAAFTHLIAWALVPAVLVLFALDRGFHMRQRETLRAGLALAAGGLLSALSFYGSFGFRFADHWHSLVAYRGYFGAAEEAPAYARVLAIHLSSAVGFLTEAQRQLLTGVIASGVVASAVTALRWPESRRSMLVFVVPPAVVLLCYAASLGWYPNYHAGYTILTQVSVVWLLAAMFAMMPQAFAPGRVRQGLSLALFVLVPGLTLWAAGHKAGDASAKATAAGRWVSISDYLREVTAPLPPAARSWGTIFFGMENPTGLQLVQYVDAVRLAQRAPEAERPFLAPEYVVWSYPENRDGMMLGLRGGNNQLERLTELFGDRRYRVVSMVSAPPYGATRVYQRLGPDEPAPPLSIAVYDSATKQWLRSRGPDAVLTLSEATPVNLRIGYAGALTEHVAQRTRAAELSVGTYLLTVTFETGTANEHGRILMAGTSLLVEEAMSELGPRFDVSLYAPADTEAHLLVHHAGGPLLLSQFDTSDGAEITGLRASELLRLRDYRDERIDRSLRPLPAMTEWRPDEPTGVTAEILDGALKVSGNATQGGYQLVSPPVPVPAGRSIMLRAEFSIESGRVCVGVLTGDGRRWVVPPTESKMDYRFVVPDGDAMLVVFANCNQGSDTGPPSEFTVHSASYSTEVDEGLYTDVLVEQSRQ